MSADVLMRRFLEEVWNARDFDAFPRFVAQDVRFHPPRGPTRGHDAYLAMARGLVAAFSDLRFEVKDVRASGDVAFARIVITGTNDGEFRGHPPTGRRVRVVGQPQCRLRDGKVIEFWQLFDELGMLHQLGHLDDARLLGPATGPPADDWS